MSFSIFMFNVDFTPYRYHILFISILVVAFIASTVLRKILSLFIRKYSGRLKTDPTNFSFLKNSVSFIIYGAAITFIFFKIPFFKEIGAALFASAGIFAAIIGFASQKAFSNIISGIFILIFKPFRVTDVIEFTDLRKGVVEEITLRHTIIKDYENRRIIIPNSIVSEATIINSNIEDEKIKKHIEFSISYESNIDKAIEIISTEIANHPLCIDNRNDEQKNNKEPKVMVRVIELADFAVILKAYAWAKNNDDGFVLKCDSLKSVKERFDQEGIEIPYPHRTIVYKNNSNRPPAILT